ncbi:lytic transglycosylase domain-containing protein [Serratia quinivorans]|uniref:lytic transglycosylase domain-containing protein n=1 Tax=Serratia quinivorans TaxID=137545 RepID=UPI001C46CCF9|nr:lytic transglycosylase domain-containing protein [Serratia quinivorans]MBV6695267.1 lytic transglycosylase domain-containing protein [Serratia quinivorans]
MISSTTFIALAMQCAATVHPDTAMDVARVESGFNPYAIAEIIPKKQRLEGGRSVITHLPKNKSDAISIVNDIEKKKRRYSVGLMQITSTNFAKFNVDAEKLFNPCINLTVFEKIITDCYTRGKTLKNGLSCYYTGNFNTGKKKESEFNQTSYIERIGYPDSPGKTYIVPSTKEDKGEVKKEEIDVKEKTSKEPTTIYPSRLIRGDLQLSKN